MKLTLFTTASALAAFAAALGLSGCKRPEAPSSAPAVSSTASASSTSSTSSASSPLQGVTPAPSPDSRGIQAATDRPTAMPMGAVEPGQAAKGAGPGSGGRVPEPTAGDGHPAASAPSR